MPNWPKYFWVLGRFYLETFLRSACLGWLCQTPRSNAGYLGVSTLHTAKIRSLDQPQHRNFNYNITNDFFTLHTFQDLAGYPRILGIVDLRPLRGRHAYKAFLRSALPDSLQLC
jgi:hypothetical protein